MKEIELTKGQVTLVDDIDYEYLMQWKWFASWSRNGFRATRKAPRNGFQSSRKSLSVGKQRTISMYTVIAKRMGIDTTCIDHIDHNTLNNCRSNLRCATVSQNLHNRGANKDSKTGVKGVSPYKKSNRYQASICVEGKHYYLGLFDTIAEAKKVVIAKREELVGDFACH